MQEMAPKVNPPWVSVRRARYRGPAQSAGLGCLQRRPGLGDEVIGMRSWDEVMGMAMRECVTNWQNSIGILLFSMFVVVSNSPTDAVVRVRKMRNPRRTAA